LCPPSIQSHMFLPPPLQVLARTPHIHIRVLPRKLRNSAMDATMDGSNTGADDPLHAIMCFSLRAMAESSGKQIEVLNFEWESAQCVFSEWGRMSGQRRCH
jgi:hypothetical protein